MKQNRTERLAVAVATGSTIRAAAAGIGISQRTGYRLCKEPEFEKRVREIRGEITVAVVANLTDAASDATETLRALLSEDQSPTVRISAAKSILQNLTPLSERLKPPREPLDLDDLLAQFQPNEAAKKAENERPTEVR